MSARWPAPPSRMSRAAPKPAAGNAAADYFGGRPQAGAMPRATQGRRSSSWEHTLAPTKIQPFIRRPLISNRRVPGTARSVACGRPVLRRRPQPHNRTWQEPADGIADVWCPYERAHSSPQEKIRVAWIVAFGLLLGLTVLLGVLSVPPPTTHGATPLPARSSSPEPLGSSGSSGSVSPGTQSAAAAPTSAPTASGPDLTPWVVLSALGTAVAGLGALISSLAAVFAVRATARQGGARTQPAARTAAKGKKKR